MNKRLGESHEARELRLFIDNESDIYFRFVVPTRKCLQRHFDRADYSSDRARDQWKRVADFSAKEYAKKYANPSNWNKIFSVADREQVATMLEEYWHTELESGNREN